MLELSRKAKLGLGPTTLPLVRSGSIRDKFATTALGI
jgi:hypothetical protein